MKIESIVGMNLKYLRYKSGLSQERFYEKLGLNHKYMASIERGEVNVSIVFLSNLAKLMEVDIREFLNPDTSRLVMKKRIDERKKTNS